MARPELGTKRVCPETGRKFYDLNKDPIVSPYTGQTYPRNFFEAGESAVEETAEAEEKELDGESEGPEVVSLEDADEETSSNEKADVPDLDDSEEEVELGNEDETTFLESEEDGGDDVKGIIGVGDDEEES